MQLLLHFQTAAADDGRFDTFLGEVKILAQKHGISVDDYRLMALPGSEDKVGPCAHCGYFTVNRADVSGEDANPRPNLLSLVRRGVLANGKFRCEYCLDRTAI
jgi:hypothetical protein